MIIYVNPTFPITYKEKSLLGIGVFPGFTEGFNKVADDAAPDATHWSIVENGAGTVVVQNDTVNKNGFLICSSGGGAGDDALAFTKDKLVFALKYHTNTLHMKSYAKIHFINNATKTGCFGFIANEKVLAECADFTVADSYCAVLSTDSWVPYFCTSDGAILEKTNLSTWIVDDTWFEFEIIISATDVKFYINGILRVTHVTRVPISVWQLAAGSTQAGEETMTCLEELFIWCEP
ncbi:hypothetical protein ES703_32175 [subsurface metagenome]